MSRDNNSELKIVYGIKFMADEEQTKKVNDSLLRDSKVGYLPRRLRKNIYFTSQIEAMKVVDYLNSLNDGKHYQIFPTSLGSLNRVKNLVENDEEIKANSATMYCRMTGYKIYDSADEYLDLIKNREENVTL